MRAVFAGKEPHAYFLVGETATGKTDVAHCLAFRCGGRVLSADAMLVYRGLDIGTAKPSPACRSEVPYFGIDLVSPDCSFSVWAYCEHVRTVLDRLRTENCPLIVAGGTGLYVRALLEGLPDGGAAPSDRTHWYAALQQGGVESLQETLKRRSPEWFAALADPCNPRRLIRALELAEAGVRPGQGRADAASLPRVVGLAWEPSALERRIRERVERMYAGGLLAEAEALRDAGGLSPTARQAIGYAEAFAVLAGTLTGEEARERTVVRTRRLAKRQRTWLRGQLNVVWVNVCEAMKVECVADAVEAMWRKYGPDRIAL